MFLEEAGEMLRIFKAQFFGNLCHRLPAHQQTLGAVDQETLDDAGGTVAREAADHITKIAGREAQFRGTILDVRQAMKELLLPLIVVCQHPLEARQQIALLLSRRFELLLVEQLAVVTYLDDVVLHDSVGQRGLLTVLDEVAYHSHQLPHQLLLAFCRP